jgi:hypothetical protein
MCSVIEAIHGVSLTVSVVVVDKQRWGKLRTIETLSIRLQEDQDGRKQPAIVTAEGQKVKKAERFTRRLLLRGSHRVCPALLFSSLYCSVQT